MKTAEKIAKILNEHCPAFRREHGAGAATWHECKCLAQCSHDVNSIESCTCVWHQTDTCVAGTWPQLAFVSEQKNQQRKRVDGYLEQAKKAIK